MDKDTQLLNKIYEGTCIGSKTLNAILPNVENPSLRRAVISQINRYDKINSDAKSEMANLGKDPKNPIFASAMAVAEAKITTSADKTPSHIAEMIVKGSNMGIINITKELNKSSFCKPSSYDLGRRLVRAEENNIEAIKVFL